MLHLILTQSKNVEDIRNLSLHVRLVATSSPLHAQNLKINVQVYIMLCLILTNAEHGLLSLLSLCKCVSNGVLSVGTFYLQARHCR
jgi:hypothetical protein